MFILMSLNYNLVLFYCYLMLLNDDLLLFYGIYIYIYIFFFNVDNVLFMLIKSTIWEQIWCLIVQDEHWTKL